LIRRFRLFSPPLPKRCVVNTVANPLLTLAEARCGGETKPPCPFFFFNRIGNRHRIFPSPFPPLFEVCDSFTGIRDLLLHLSFSPRDVFLRRTHAAFSFFPPLSLSNRGHISIVFLPPPFPPLPSVSKSGVTNGPLLFSFFLFPLQTVTAIFLPCRDSRHRRSAPPFFFRLVE